MKKLTKAEEEVIQIIWAKGRCTVSQILPDLVIRHHVIPPFLPLPAS